MNWIHLVVYTQQCVLGDRNSSLAAAAAAPVLKTHSYAVQRLEPQVDPLFWFGFFVHFLIGSTDIYSKYQIPAG